MSVIAAAAREHLILHCDAVLKRSNYHWPTYPIFTKDTWLVDECLH